MSTVMHPLTEAEAHALERVLHSVEHIDVTVAVVGQVAHVRPAAPLSTPNEVTVLCAVTAVTDAVVLDWPEPFPYGTGCHCDWLGVGAPEHTPSPLCMALRPDADRDGGAR